MTVQATASPVADGTAAGQFADIYRQNYRRLVRYLAWMLNAPHHPLAEDLAQETFLALWRDYVAKDDSGIREPEKVYGLLKVIARHRVHDHFKASRNQEATVDFGDPLNRDLEVKHGYALGTPAVSLLVSELDAAMERMTEASETWRSLNKESIRLRTLLTDDYRSHMGGLCAFNRTEYEQRAEESEQREESALAAFRQACQHVGELRAEIERTAGANWRSCVGMPASQAPHAPLSYAKDPTATHCSKGHQLDRMNTAFTPEGDRSCRACRRDKHLRRKPRNTTSTNRGRAATDPAVFEQARQLLADPDAGHTMSSVAKRLGVSQSTLSRAFPGGVAAIRQAALAGAAR